MTTGGQPEPAGGYQPFFGLHEAPFSLAADLRFLFASASHSAAMAQVAYALERREPLVVITGEIGSGKTLLCRTLLQQIRPKTFLSVIHDPLLERDDLLKQMLQDFGVISKDRARLAEVSRHDLIEALEAFLRSLAPLHAHAAVIVDEAQHLRPDVLEQIRLLANIDDARGTLLQIILVGQADLEPLLARPELRQLQQRVSRRFRLEPLNKDEVKHYIAHRLELARDGAPPDQSRDSNELARQLDDWSGTNTDAAFAPDAVQLISQLSGGLPRVVNLLCDRSLEEAFASGVRLIDRPLVLTAAGALGLGESGTPVSLHAAARSTGPGPDQPFWMVERASPETVVPIPEHADETAAVVLRPRPAAPSRVTTYLVVAVAFAVAALAGWMFFRPAETPAARPPPTAAAAPAIPPPSAPPASPPAGTTALAPKPAPLAAPASSPEPAAPVPTRPAATPAGGRFDIVVASFRTDARAAAVAAAVAALGLPIRRRVSSGWQQVISGPFTSRAAAEEAQGRLNRAGLGGTTIVANER